VEGEQGVIEGLISLKYKIFRDEIPLLTMNMQVEM
jgi:hypothetical protein